MILGLGTDLVNIDRIEAALERHEARFLARSFTPAEIALADSRPAMRAATLAKRWAAKEACAKALGTGIGRGFGLTDIEVVRNDLGAPSIALYAGAADRLAAITPPGHTSCLHLSLTDDLPWASATVIIETLPL
ncbi:holo-[acyl-carrier protein] synthase [Novosphingobium sp. SG751A]|uniref:holo-ACP synthase n=1 Tax=Novosphingobium sp. SG751A TaxID=2587000 RepID=UPI0015539D2E|nr:holo-ACP synthase [Novosphingobium sp. SG751A]NOW47331.1 holo-[acyl-carrier protein] synthase [Novosphingobium sp. SG751A]